MKTQKRKKLSILGCGWVGKAVPEKLSPTYDVICLSKNIEENIKNGAYTTDILLIAIPPRGEYIEVLEKTLGLLSSHTQIVLLSSISFYDKKTLVVEAELLVKKFANPWVILRLGGLMGYDRIAGKYSAGKSVAFDGNTNYIHKDDVVGVIERVIELKVSSEIFDVVAPKQSTKKIVYTQNSKQFGFEESYFEGSFREGKRLSYAKVCDRLEYQFIYEDVLDFWKGISNPF